MKNALHILITVCFSQLLSYAQTTPQHFSHNPANARVNNLFFHDNLCHKFLFIYTQAEIAGMTPAVTGPVTIDTIWFRNGGGSSNPTTVLSNLVITLGHTTLTVPSATFANNFNAGAPAVVLNTPALSYTPLTGTWNQPNHNWTYIALQTPFTYNFTDNLAVQFEFSSSSSFIMAHYADNGGIPITQYDALNTATAASSTTARPMFGISAGCGAPVQLGADTTLCAGQTLTLNASVPNATYLWSDGTSGSSVNVNSSGTYWLQVTDSCGTRSDSITVQFNALPVAQAGSDQSICAGQQVTLNASGGTNYSWLPSPGLSNAGISNPTASPNTTTTYIVTVSNGNCSDVDTVTVIVNQPPLADAGTAVMIPIGGNTSLAATGNGTYAWSPSATLSCANCANPVASPTSTTTYTLIVTDSNGCTASDTVTVFVDVNCGDVFVPTALSPNNDGVNDGICVYGNCITTMTFMIFNRWGEKVFETTDRSVCWDGTYKGKELGSEVFVYRLEAVLLTGEIISRKGNITVVR